MYAAGIIYLGQDRTIQLLLLHYIAAGINLFCGDNSATIVESALLSKIDGFEGWCKGHSDIEDIYDYYSLDLHINPTSVSFSEDKKSISALLKKLDEYIKTKNVDLFTGTKDFIMSSALYGIDVLTENMSADADTVKLMTLHSAKGLEFKQVYIIGVNNGLIPLFTSGDNDELEERRLFFVGVTRAKDFLELSYYTSPDESRVLPGSSRYLSLIPDRLIDTEGFVQQTADLQHIRHEITESKNAYRTIIADEAEKAVQSASVRTVCHPQYGTGTVIKEDENMISVAFDGYGEKEFMKAFSELKNVQEL